MEIIINNADFMSVAKTKILEEYKADVFGSYITSTGDIGASSNFDRTDCIAITESMRVNGIACFKAKSNSTYPAIVFFNDINPSSTTYVNKIHCSKYTVRDIYIYPEQIPALATHFVVNCFVDAGAKVFDSFLINVLDIEWSDGYISPSNRWVDTETHQTSQFIPVNSNSLYYFRAAIIAEYDKDGVFIERITPSIITTATGKTTLFAENIAYIRIGGIKTGAPYFIKI